MTPNPSVHLRQILEISLPFVVLALLVWLAWKIAGRNSRPFSRSALILRKLAKYPFIPPILVFCVALANGLLLTWVAGIPIPRVHDEFSYLLAADTFAHGRMTNPTPPIWKNFETMHEFFEPTYASKFQPLQGVTLALGQKFSDGPWVGALVTNAIACALMTWALRAWIRPKWALLAGLLVSVHPQLMEWGHSYWGGGVGMVGGSLVFGALGRIEKNTAGLVFWSILLALGGAIVAGTRPYEAFVWGVICGFTLLILVFQRRNELRKYLLKLVVPIICVLIPAGALQAYYDKRVTGDPFLLPYVHHVHLYMSVPVMLWQPLPPVKQYSVEQLQQQYNEFEYNFYMDERSSLHGYLKRGLQKVYFFGEAHILRNLPLLLGLLFVPFALGRNRMIWLVLAFGIVIIFSYAITPFLIPHYIGPYMGVMFVLAMRGLRRAKMWKLHGWPMGRAVVGLSLLTSLPMVPFIYYNEWIDTKTDWGIQRQAVEQKLSAQPGDHLVFVHYQHDHIFHHEWVFNGADIDSGKIIWARQLDPEQDRMLAEHYAGRQVWIVHADEVPARLEPVGPTTQSSDRSSGSGSTNPSKGI